MNATHFFEKNDGDRSFPPSSESFWSTVFAFFVLHLAASGNETTLRVWQPRAGDAPPWYEPKRDAPLFDFRGLSFDGVAVEPNTLASIWPLADIKMTGISPDLVLRFVDSPVRYALIENKITSGADLRSNQLTSYPELIKWLGRQSTDARLFILKSVGCAPNLYAHANYLHLQLGDRFGILLWEDVFRAMLRSRFSLPGLDPARLQAYTHGEQDCANWR